MMNANFHLTNRQEIVTCAHECLSIGTSHADFISIFATPEQLKRIADTIYIQLAYLEDVKAQQDQLELHFEHQKELEVAV